MLRSNIYTIKFFIGAVTISRSSPLHTELVTCFKNLGVGEGEREERGKASELRSEQNYQYFCYS